MEDQRFDELTKRLATPITRRQAFKALMAAAMGGLIIRSGGGKAFAQMGGNAGCPQFCNQQFAPGSARGKCKSDAVQGGGLCYQCGPGSNTCGLTACNGVCCAQGAGCSNGTCACPPGQAVCGAGGAACFGVGTCTDLTTIQNCAACSKVCGGVQPGCCKGSCTDLAGDVRNCGSCGNACAQGQTCTNGKCQSSSPNPECAGKGCGSLNLMCNNNPYCVCTTIFGGTGGMCMSAAVLCSALSTCPTGSECNAGELCLINTCCGANVCVPLSNQCPPSATTAATRPAAAPRTSSHDGPTIGSR
jgi:hypothetical protein